MIFYPKNKRGFLDMTLLLVIVAITLGIALTSGFKSKTPRGTETFSPEAPTTAPEQKKNLQLGTLPFKKTPQTFDCGPGTVPSREAVILWAMDPAPGSPVGPGGSIKLFYSDEWPLTLGKGSVSPVNSEKHIVKPNLSVGDLTARDGSGLPYFPALFLSDITDNASNNSGDAERGGTPIPPDEVWGSWQALGAQSTGGSFQGAGSLPAGADPFPQESNVNFEQDRSLHGVPHGNHYAEIIWKVDSLGLISGHTYRAQFIIHDGDFEGDLAEGCTTIAF